MEFTISLVDRDAGMFFDPSDSGLQALAETMQKEGKLGEAINELLAERETHVKRIAELDTAIRVLQTIGGNGTPSETMVLHKEEFANAGIAEAAVAMIKRANRPLHVRDIMKGLEAGGYKFKGENPLNSVAPVMYLAHSNGHKHGIVRTGKNVYSLLEIEERKGK
jgi:hypothetical protein